MLFYIKKTSPPDYSFKIFLSLNKTNYVIPMHVSSENPNPSEEILKWIKRIFYVSLTTLIVITLAVVIAFCENKI